MQVADQLRYHEEKYLDQAKEWTNKYARQSQEEVVVDLKKRNLPEDQLGAAAAKRLKHDIENL